MNSSYGVGEKGRGNQAAAVEVTVLTLAPDHEQETLQNHRIYCQLMGYRHVHMQWPEHMAEQFKTNFRVAAVLHQLRSLPEGSILVCATTGVLFLNPLRVESLMTEKDHLLLRMWSPSAPHDVAAYADELECWRSSAFVLAAFAGLFAQMDVATSVGQRKETLRRWREQWSWLAPDAYVGSILPCLEGGPSFLPRWFKRSDVLAVRVAGPVSDGGLLPGPFRRVLADNFNCYLSGRAEPVYLAQALAPVEPSAYEVLNPGAAVALVMLYTPNIRVFGAIAERNVRAYCLRHGYALHLYREIPSNWVGGSGNWAKPRLLREHLPQHEWVIWMDADMLFHDARQPLEPLLQERDVLAAHDVGNWLLNSGFIGFRRTDRNATLLTEVCQRVEALKDRSNVYASGGDQQMFCDVLLEAGLKRGDNWDYFAVNTPWMFRQRTSFCVHYYGMDTTMRAMMMAAHESEVINEE